MAPHDDIIRFQLSHKPVGDPAYRGVADGAWWPQDRVLADRLKDLVELWPPSQPRIDRLIYSPPDWDDRPRKVAVGQRWIKTGNFPEDDTHTIVLSLSDGTRRTIDVVAPDTDPAAAAKLLTSMPVSTS